MTWELSGYIKRFCAFGLPAPSPHLRFIFLPQPAIMICLMQSQSPISTATIILYTCIWIPFLQIKQAMLKMIRLVWCDECQEAGDNGVVLELDATIFSDIDRLNLGLGEGCSICLVEYAKEDLVYRLHRCAHLFHVHCINSWLDRNHFTCPLCRSLLLHRAG